MLQPKGFGRIRVQQIDRGDQENLMPFIKTSIRPGSLIHSDGSPAYRQLQENGYGHRQTVHLGSVTPAHESMPGVHRVASLLQRWIMGTHQAQCSLDSWTIISMSMYFGSIGEPHDHAGYCFIACFSKRLLQSRSPTRASWKSGENLVIDCCGAKGIPRVAVQYIYLQAPSVPAMPPAHGQPDNDARGRARVVLIAAQSAHRLRDTS